MDWILGIGNELRGDDGIGPAVARRLQDTPATHADGVGQLTPELAESLSAVGRVLFVDASLTADRVELRSIAPRPARGIGHALSPEGLLELTERAFGRAPEGWLLSIPGRSFVQGEGLSPESEARIDEAEAMVHEWLRRTAVTIDG